MESDHSDGLLDLLALNILDSPPEALFDDLASLAARIAHCSNAGIAFFDQKRFWLKANLGFENSEYRLTGSLLEGSKTSEEGNVVGCKSDLSPTPTNAQFFATFFLLHSKRGNPIGALLLCDKTEFLLNESQQELLAKVSSLITNHLASRVQDSPIGNEEWKRQMLLKEKLSSLGQMAAMIIHEVNNPLAVINASADSLLEKIEQETFAAKGPVVERIERIRRMGQLIAKIVKGIKSISRDSSEDPFELVRVELIVENVLGICRERLTKNGITLKLDLEKSLTVKCRPGELTQVILNLVMNAHDAIETLPEKWIMVQAASSAGNCKIAIVDSGHGIPAELQKKVLLPFFTTKGVGKGTGLGLSVAKKIIEEGKGSFRYDAQAKNTTFVIELPKQ